MSDLKFYRYGNQSLTNTWCLYKMVAQNTMHMGEVNQVIRSVFVYIDSSFKFEIIFFIKLAQPVLSNHLMQVPLTNTELYAWRAVVSKLLEMNVRQLGNIGLCLPSFKHPLLVIEILGIFLHSK